VLVYLSRCTHRVAIWNQRLLAFDEHGVTFRWKDYRATGKTRHKTMTLGADEFMRRFLLHVLPGGFHRIRHCGLLTNAGRRKHLARTRELLHVVPAGDEQATIANVHPTFLCLHCGAAMIIVDTFARGQPIRAPPACELQRDLWHRSLRSVRSSSAIAESGRLCLSLSKCRLSPAGSSDNPVSHRSDQTSARSWLQSEAPITAFGTITNHQIPIAV